MTITTQKYTQISEKIQREIVRKAIHFLIAFVPQLAYIDRTITMVLLAVGTLVYVIAEKLRNEGFSVYIVSDLTFIASRDRNSGRFELGPVTLGLGAMMALLLYPEPSSSIAIYALAFGDGFASLVGITFGRIRIPFTGGKTIAGSFACFISVYIVTLMLLRNQTAALTIAALAAFLEAFPTGDLDNIILPVGVGFAASLFII